METLTSLQSDEAERAHAITKETIIKIDSYPRELESKTKSGVDVNGSVVLFTPESC